LVTDPPYLNVAILPNDVKGKYLKEYMTLLEELDINEPVVEYNESDPNNYKQVIASQIQQIINVLGQPAPDDQESLLDNLVTQCRKWDQEFNFNARMLYPELTAVWNKYGY
jgi:hypothetical protein